MSQLFANNAYSALGSSILIGATSLTLASGTGSRFPTPSGGDYFLLTLADTSGGSESAWEIVKVTARSVDTLTIERAQEGTTARAWASGVPVDLRITAGSLAGYTTLTGAQTLTNKTLVTPLLGTPTSGNLSNCTADGTNSVGFKLVPQNTQSAAYTLVLADSGKHLLHPSADTTARIFTIPSNASVAFPVGTAVTFINQSGGGVITITPTDTMRLAGPGTTGSRTLAANGIATAIKVAATEWLISGTNLT